ncbi:putative serine protease PepD [Brevibacterium sp. 239c]|uniref:trypsin-like peptidase domain-containing protein n=1 Tax=Brevibacterium sp. 239c TaxID=1965356 RepID=UPI000C5E3F3F|nr:trypsin-like peptidase domain-containing protein [Brevibacterium sp. 239c]SMY03172.1 putative serine protease PepD [Brevibacterium sp. 239c]
MSSNDPNNQGYNSNNRGRHGDQDHRTFPTDADGSRDSSDVPRNSTAGPQRPTDGSRRSAEIPRTFPNGSNSANGSNGPARVSPPVAPSARPTGPNSQNSQNGPDSPDNPEQGQGQGGNAGQGQAPWQGQDPRQGQRFDHNQDQNPPQGQPTRAQPPVDGSRGQTGQPGQPGQGPSQNYGSSQRFDRSPDNGTSSHNGYPYARATTPNGPAQAGPNSPTDANAPYGTPYSQGAGQPALGAGVGVAAGAGAGAAAGTGSNAHGHYGNQPNQGGYPASGSAGFQSGPGGPGGPGAPGGPGGPGGPGPYGSEAPPRREKRGPGWGATIAIALIAALLGGGAAFGGSYAVSALGGDEPRKVAGQTIETPDWTEVAKQTSQSVVSIQVGTDGKVQALGSGSLYDDQGHVITNNHVVAPADTPSGEIAVTMKSGETMKAKIVGRDPSTDIAVIKLDQVPKDVDPLPVGDSKKMKVGDPVMALGNPLGLADSVTTGIVSALDRPVSTENIGEDATSQEKEMTITNAIQTDAAINPGNSGGPLVDGDGNFIGVNSAAASLSQAGEDGQSGSIGIGFAIPSSQAVMIADQLIANGKALHPFLGITLTDGQINSGGTTRGSAKVQSVQSGSPAAKAGFKDGDDIVSVSGTKVNNAIALRALVRAQPTNSPVDFTVIRGGQEQTLKTTLVLK